MSPIGNPPSAQEGGDGDKQGKGTYATQRNLDSNNTRSVHNQISFVELAETPISHKPKRNSNQRQPKKLTLKDYFPIYIKPTMSKPSTHEVQLETNNHFLRKTRAQTVYKARRKDKQSEKRSQGDLQIITPGGSPKNQQQKNRKGKNYSGANVKRMNPKSTMATVKEPKSRQSKLYDNEQWIRDEKSRETAGSFFGHSMEAIDSTTVYRVLLQNANGIDPDPKNSEFQLSLNTCYDQCVAFISLTETNINWLQFKHKENLRLSLHKWWDGAVQQTSTSTIPFVEKYKPGGTASLVCGNHWAARVIERGEDESGLGRWTFVGLQGDQQTKILHITWYLVCKQSVSTAGEKTAFMQQYTILCEKFPDLEINPRRQSVLDMQLLITKKQKEGYLIILSTDGNENLSGARGKFCPVESETMHAFSKEHDGSILTLITTCGLVDALHMQHNKDQYPATYIRGRNRIDGIFISHQLAHAVLRTGLTPFHTFFQGDHRAVFVDFSANLLFKSNTYEFVRQKGRGLQIGDPRIVDKYILALFEQLEYHKVMQKLERLMKIRVDEWTEADRGTYEKLDRLITESMIYAEKECARRYSTKFHWSPLLLQAVYAYRYARLRLKEYNGIPVTVKALQYHAKQAMITEIEQKELDAVDKIVDFLRQAKKRMKEYQQKHIELRKEYVEGLAEARVMHRFPTSEKGTEFFEKQKERQLKALSNRESARAMHSKIRSALHRNQGGGTTRVDVPDAANLRSIDGQPLGDPQDPKHWKGPWITISEPDEMLTTIMTANIKQYNQAHDTPFAKEPLYSLFGPDGTTPFAQEFLKGRPIPTEIFNQLLPETQRILNTYQEPAKFQYEKEAVITPSKFISCYKNVDNKTSSSILSKRHIGHYQASLEHLSLVQMHSDMMTLPYKHGFTPDRWRDVVDVVLPKDEGQYKIHRFRIIRLVESDFNQSLGMIFARPMSHFMEDQNLYPEMQYGSRDGRMCVSAVLNKVLTFDIIRMRKVVAATEENDAVGCYDRVMQQEVSLYLQRMGVALAAISCVCRAFDETRHYIKTAHGLSKTYYEGTKDVPLFGAGQGTTGGPFFWLLLFSLMLEAFDPTMKGMKFTSPCRTIKSERYGDAFVDDTKFGVTADEQEGYYDPTQTATQEQVQQVLRDLTRLSQHYEKLLFTSGGALNIKKCHWIMMAWRWVDGRAYLMTSEECPGKLFLTSGSSTELEEVPRLEPNSSYRTLGVHISVTGSMKQALKLSRQKSETYAGLLQTSSLTRCEAYFSYILYFYPKLLYAAPVSTYTLRQSTFIQAPAMAAVLPKMGLNRHTSKDILHGSSQYGGLQLPHIYLDQGIGQLRLLLGHIRRGDETSRLLRVAITVMQQQVGSKILFFNLPYPKYAGWVEKTWLVSLWQFLHTLDIQVRLSNIPLPKEQRENDIFLMTEFIYLGFKKAELGLLNQCRLYHQVLSLADIASADGLTIDPVYMTNKRHQDRVSSLQWPIQGRPSSKAWRQWKRALQYLLYKGKLHKPLGRWTCLQHQQWNWVVRLSDKVLFHRSQQGWKRYDPIAVLGERRTRSSGKPWYCATQWRYSREPVNDLAAATIQPTEIDGDMFTITWSVAFDEPLEGGREPAGGRDSSASSSSTEPTRNEILDNRTGTVVSQPQLPTYVPRFLAYIKKSAYFTRLVGPIRRPREEDLLELTTYIEAGTLLGCSDGSFSPISGKGSHAWLFSTPEGEILLQGAGPIDGNPTMMSSYRTELGGITTLLFLLYVITETYGIRGGIVTVYCDNTSALENIFEDDMKRGIFPLLAVDYDLLVLAREIRRSLPIKVLGRWVKGHFTGDERRVEHDLNDLVNDIANHFREDPPRGSEPSSNPMFHRTLVAAAYMEGSMITSKLACTIYERFFQESLTLTICKYNKWSKETFHKIDWDIFGKVFSSYSRFHQISIAKFIHGLWNTGYQKVKYKQEQEGLCPCCKTMVETVNHVFQCKDPSVVGHRQQQIKLFHDYLDEQELPKPVRQCMFSGVEGWLQSQDERPALVAPTKGKVMPADQLATNAFVEQTRIGWDAFFRGQISVAWRRAILLSSPIRDEDAAEIHLRRILKRLHSLSLEVWEFRNDVLHGATVEQSRAIARAATQEQVTRLYELYTSGSLLLLARDEYLFTRKSLTMRLAGDTDSLLRWIRIVELAVKAYEGYHQKIQQNAERFFRRFRELGRKKLQNSIQVNLAQGGTDPLLDGGERWVALGNHSQRMTEQILTEVSQQTQRMQRSRAKRPPAVEGLADTILSNELLSLREEDGQSIEESVISPGPYYVAPLIDGEYSTDDSSYSLSYQRDVRFDYDSDLSSEGSSATPEGYRARRRQSQLDRADRLLQQLELMNDISQRDEKISEPIAFSTYASLEDLRQEATSPSEVSSFTTTTTVGEDSEGLPEAFNCRGCQQIPGTESYASEFYAMIHYLNRFRQHRGSPIPPSHGQLLTGNQSCSSSVISEASSRIPFSAENASASPSRIVIEELECSEPPLVRTPPPSFPLAQESDCTSATSDISDGPKQQDDILEFREWIASLGGFTPPVSDSDFASTLASFRRSSNSSQTSTSTPVIEEIFSEDYGGIAEDTTGSLSEGYGWRSLPIHPDDTSRTGETEEAPQSEVDNLLIQEQGGSLQGTPMSPWQYMLAFQQQGDEAASIPASLPSLTSGNYEPSSSSQSYSLDSSVEGWEVYTRSSDTSTILQEGMDMEGDTVATTSSSITSVSVRELFVAFGDGGFTPEIPFPEQDDPPDSGTSVAASLEIDREIEQMRLGETNRTS